MSSSLVTVVFLFLSILLNVTAMGPCDSGIVAKLDEGIKLPMNHYKGKYTFHMFDNVTKDGIFSALVDFEHEESTIKGHYTLYTYSYTPKSFTTIFTQKDRFVKGDSYQTESGEYEYRSYQCDNILSITFICNPSLTSGNPVFTIEAPEKSAVSDEAKKNCTDMIKQASPNTEMADLRIRGGT